MDFSSASCLLIRSSSSPPRAWPLADEAVANKAFETLDDITDTLDRRYFDLIRSMPSFHQRADQPIGLGKAFGQDPNDVLVEQRRDIGCVFLHLPEGLDGKPPGNGAVIGNDRCGPGFAQIERDLAYNRTRSHGA